MAAIHAQSAGLRVVLIEKESAVNHKICGEFVSHEGVLLLSEVGIDLEKMGGQSLSGFRLHGPRLTAKCRLSAAGVGISRKRLDEKLIERAEAEGADVRLGVELNEVIEGLDGLSNLFLLDTSAGQIRAQRLIMATGRAGVGGESDIIDSGYASFKIHLRLKPSVAKKMKQACDIVVFDHGYGALVPIEDGLVNFTMMIERAALRTIGETWDELAAHIGRTCWEASHFLDGAEPVMAEPLKALSIPRGFVRRTPAPTGMFFVGDQMAFIPSLTGDGTTVAMLTGKRAAEEAVEKIAGHSRLRFAAHASVSYQQQMRAILRPYLDTGIYLHRLFRNPRLTDIAIRAIHKLPGILDFFIMATRVHPDERATRLVRLNQMAGAVSRVRDVSPV